MATYCTKHSSNTSSRQHGVEVGGRPAATARCVGSSQGVDHRNGSEGTHGEAEEGARRGRPRRGATVLLLNCE
eukprot:365602-Chlamydomonas_euryale.AAC.9